MIWSKARRARTETQTNSWPFLAGTPLGLRGLTRTSFKRIPCEPEAIVPEVSTP
jgi:hypothetical protein